MLTVILTNRVGARSLVDRATSHTAECADHADRGSVVKRPGVPYSIPLMLHGLAIPSDSVLFSGKYPFLRRQLLLRIIGCFKYGLSPPSTPSLFPTFTGVIDTMGRADFSPFVVTTDLCLIGSVRWRDLPG